MNWIGKDKRKPEMEKRVLGWHQLGGAVAIYGKEVWENPFVTHWAEIPEDGWTDRRDRLPEKEDTDYTGCVLAAVNGREERCVRYEFVQTDESYTRWARLPGTPEK